MNLIDDWLNVLKKAWSVRLLILAGLMSGVEVALNLFADDPPIQQGLFAALSALATAAAFVARLVAQEAISGKKTGETDEVEV